MTMIDFVNGDVDGEYIPTPRLYIAAAFSLSMLYRGDQADPDFARKPMPVESDQEALDLLASCRLDGYDVVSVVGHADTARVIGAILGLDLAVSRESIRLEPDDVLLVAQVVSQAGGPVRLPVGADTLPDSVRLEWWRV